MVLFETFFCLCETFDIDVVICFELFIWDTMYEMFNLELCICDLYLLNFELCLCISNLVLCLLLVILLICVKN